MWLQYIGSCNLYARLEKQSKYQSTKDENISMKEKVKSA